MIELICVYCLISNSSACVEKRIPMEDFRTQAACVVAGEQRAQEYVVGHPKYRLSSWRCEIDIPRQAPA